MKYFFDTEFYERGPKYPIELISIGIVAEDGREFYAENIEVNLDELSPWLKQNVMPHLIRSRADLPHTDTTQPAVLAPHGKIGQAVLQFLGMDVKPEFWAYFADYDWVVFCQLYGSMVGLPPIFPYYCRDLKQEMDRRGMSKPLIEGCGPGHNALADARWVRAAYNYMMENYP